MICTFDLETGSLPAAEVLANSKPFPDFSPMGPFDEAAVKLGQMKDPVKIAAKIEECRKKHVAEAEQQESKYATEKAAYEQELISQAALSATTGKVECIGVYDPTFTPSYCYFGAGGEDESTIITRFWKYLSMVLAARRKIVGHNIHGFDLPFLMRRSWVLDIPVPVGLLDKGRYWHPAIIDTLNVWKCGAYGQGQGVSLDVLMKLFGMEGKNGKGEDFARLFRDPATRQQALDYLKNDLDGHYTAAIRMGVGS